MVSVPAVVVAVLVRTAPLKALIVASLCMLGDLLVFRGLSGCGGLGLYRLRRWRGRLCGLGFRAISVCLSFFRAYGIFSGFVAFAGFRRFNGRRRSGRT